ncbi:MAG: Guanylate kinase [Candidatus Scalindua rubra]|uniref:Guanylate kinase n=1 Tax=Candidatus Scalindua rubra TaxID=1872076 RepID=A0A1E3X9I4_9BACT|nr:MAG: Guanylate kinase [Candidatus Scalindua rubra]
MELKIVTVGMVPFSEDHLKYISENIGIEPKELIKLDSQTRLTIRGKDKESKIKTRAENAFEEFKGALQAEHIIVNPHGEDDKESWEKRTWGVQLVIKQFQAIIEKFKGRKILLVLCGPSCVGKGPLEEVFFTEIFEQQKLNVGKAVIYVDIKQRPPRKGESEGNPYHFRRLDEIKEMISKEPKRYIQYDVRGVTQVLDLNEIGKLLHEKDIVFVEIFYTAIPSLRKWASQ